MAPGPGEGPRRPRAAETCRRNFLDDAKIWGEEEEEFSSVFGTTESALGGRRSSGEPARETNYVDNRSGRLYWSGPESFLVSCAVLEPTPPLQRRAGNVAGRDRRKRAPWRSSRPGGEDLDEVDATGEVASAGAWDYPDQRPGWLVGALGAMALVVRQLGAGVAQQTDSQ